MRLADGTLFPIPVTLPVAADAGLRVGTDIALRDSMNDLLAIMTIDELYPWDPADLAERVLGTQDRQASAGGRDGALGPAQRLRPACACCSCPRHYDFQELRRTPAEIARGPGADRPPECRGLPDAQPAAPRARGADQARASTAVDGVLLLHPVVGHDQARRRRSLHPRAHLQGAGGESTTIRTGSCLSLLPLAMRMAGPREALWHAIIRRNYGANHFIVGRDHAGPGKDSTGKPFYGPYDAQELVQAVRGRDRRHDGAVLASSLYLPDEDRYEEASNIPEGTRTATISGTQVREEFLGKGRLLPAWFTRPETAEILAEAYPPRHRQGLCIWFTGLSGAGQVDHGRGAVGPAARSRAAGHGARRRRGAHAPFEGSRLLPRGPRHQHPAHRLRGQRDRAPRRHGDVRRGLAVPRDARRGAGA